MVQPEFLHQNPSAARGARLDQIQAHCKVIAAAAAEIASRYSDTGSAMAHAESARLRGDGMCARRRAELGIARCEVRHFLCKVLDQAGQLAQVLAQRLQLLLCIGRHRVLSRQSDIAAAPGLEPGSGGSESPALSIELRGPARVRKARQSVQASAPSGPGNRYCHRGFGATGDSGAKPLGMPRLFVIHGTAEVDAAFDDQAERRGTGVS